MKQAIDTETEELSKREKYRERRGEEYDIVSKVAFLIGVPDSHWKSQYTGLDADIYEQLNENKNARIIRNLCGLRTEIERNFKRFSMLILMELKNLHTIPQTQGMVNQLRKDGIDIINYCGGTLMGTYITHEDLPFHGTLKKIRIRSCRATDPSLPGFDEKQLLEITQDGTVKLIQKTPEEAEKTKTRISQADTDYIFAAFSETFANYRRERIPSISGHWRARLLTDDNEVYFYHGANGQDYRYHDESLTDILRQRTEIQGLYGLSVKTETKSRVKSIEISLEQTAADETKDRYANEYGICIQDTNEWLLITSQGSITYNRRVANVGRVSLQYELKDKVAEFLKLYEDQSVFSRPKGNSADTVQDEIRKTYKIIVTRDGRDTSVLEGSYDKDGLPDDWADFVGKLAAFFQGQSLGILFDSRVYNKTLRKSNEVAFCGVDIDGVIGTRYYRCGDEICEGDTVVVPTPMKHTMAIGRVVKIRHYPKDQIPKDMARTQEILGLAKEIE